MSPMIGPSVENGKMDLVWAGAGFGAFVPAGGLEVFGVVEIEFGHGRLALRVSPNRNLGAVVRALRIVTAGRPDVVDLKHPEPQRERVRVGLAVLHQVRRSAQFDQAAATATAQHDQHDQHEQPDERENPSIGERGGKHNAIIAGPWRGGDSS